jgi:hypothetical protein
MSCAAARQGAQAALVPPSAQDAAPCPAAPSANGAAGAPARPATPQLAALAPGAANLARLLGSGSGRAGAPGGALGPTGGGEEAEAGGWAERAGLLPGWGMRGVAWALLSDAPGALLDACLPLARAPARPSAHRLQAWLRGLAPHALWCVGSQGEPCRPSGLNGRDVRRMRATSGRLRRVKSALTLLRGRQAAGAGADAGAPGGPKYDMTYSGEKVLDLGFGSAPAGGAAASPLAWSNMRKARRPRARAAPVPAPCRCLQAGPRAAAAGPRPASRQAPSLAARASLRRRPRRHAPGCPARAGGRGVLAARGRGGARGGAGARAVRRPARPARLRAALPRARPPGAAAGAAARRAPRRPPGSRSARGRRTAAGHAGVTFSRHRQLGVESAWRPDTATRAAQPQREHALPAPGANRAPRAGSVLHGIGLS